MIKYTGLELLEYKPFGRVLDDSYNFRPLSRSKIDPSRTLVRLSFLRLLIPTTPHVVQLHYAATQELQVI
jgi:hypothetical protein